ncbi:MAG TPA: S1 family peptidase, partial [Kofleriaceae bacterium]|nr:S1 family peptidase [Kofleriaceae bacterium]
MRGTLLLLCALTACTVEASRSDHAITNGTVDTGDPAVVALVDTSDIVACTASVIGAHTAITAAHCFINRAPHSLRVAFGSSLADATFAQIADARSHPDFDPATLAHDVAMVTFRDESPVAPLVLDTRTIDASLIGTMFRAVGFGVTASTAADAGGKREGMAQISEVTAEEFTAMPSPSQPCRGDSGGPALLASDAVAAVVSRGDGACSDHAIYARIDVARAPLVDPYLADTAPSTAHTGDACFYDGHCSEGSCLQTHDDPLLYFCSQPCARDADCPAAMECASDGCRYPEPSPGALGSACDQDPQCTSDTCRESVCTISCVLDTSACPAGYECRGVGNGEYCFAAADDGCGCASSGTSAPLWLVVIWLARARRRS